jgi:hypothetical protein
VLSAILFIFIINILADDRHVVTTMLDNLKSGTQLFVVGFSPKYNALYSGYKCHFIGTLFAVLLVEVDHFIGMAD